MKLLITILTCALVSSSLAAPTLLSADSVQPATAYPIGQSKGSNAMVAGRLFNIDGKVGYFAGSNAWWLAHLSNNADVDKTLKQVAAVSSQSPCCIQSPCVLVALTVHIDWLHDPSSLGVWRCKHNTCSYSHRP